MAAQHGSAPPGRTERSADSSEAGNLETKSSTRTGILAEHFCYCRSGFVCDLCIEWSHLIRCFEAPTTLPQAQTLRRQALGQIVGA